MAKLVTILEFPTFVRDAERLFTADELDALRQFLAASPLAGAVIPATGGVRKLRASVAGKGKRGGARVIYYFCDEDVPLALIAAYSKGEKANLTGKEKAELRVLAKEYLAAARKRRI
jgi:RelE toxin of RelE / RelB toxin-antitoxin system